MTSGEGAAAASDEIRAVPLRHPGRWVAVAVIGVLIAMLVHGLAFARIPRGNKLGPRIEWHYFGQYFASGPVLRGLVVTLELTALAMFIGIALGIVLAVMRLSPNPVVSGSAWTYVWFFRGTPVFVQLLAWGFVAAVFPTLSIGVPFSVHFVNIDANTTITPFVAGVLGLGLNEGAYMSEIVRAGILAVDQGQVEAAHALGMTQLMTLHRVVLPQAMRVIIPPTGNETISMLKTTSLVSVIAVTDLLYAVELIYSRNYKTIPLLLVAAVWYLIVTSVLTVGQYYLERFYARGSVRELPPTPLQRLLTNLTRIRPHDLPGASAEGR